MIAGQRSGEPAIHLGYVGRVPVRNLWLLMLYASELLSEPGWRRVGLEASPEEMPDLIAQLLAGAVEARLRRRLTSGYQSQRAVLSRLRGRIDLLETERRQLFARGRILCHFDELTSDSPRNRFVRAALESVARAVRDTRLARRCRSLARTMRAMGILGRASAPALLEREYFGRNDVVDQPMFTAAKLAFDLALPTECIGTNPVPSADHEGRHVRRLFERAVSGFYRFALDSQRWAVQPGKVFKWQTENETDGIGRIFPSMKVDMLLDNRAETRRIIIDTKFTSILSHGWYREQTLRSFYLYQIYAYLRSQEGRGDPLYEHATGLLLHPSVGSEVDESVTIQGHRIRFATVDLTASPVEIRSRLLSLVE